MHPIQKSIETYFGLQHLPSDQREEILQRIGKLVYEHAVIMCLKNMTESEEKEFNTMLEKNESEEEVLGYLKNTVKNFEEIVRGEVVRLKDKITFENKDSINIDK